MKITSVDLTISAVRRSQYPTDKKPEFLLVGRSNVGKSSFINTLINRKNYARTSANPGKTQTINFYLVNEKFYLVDAPGYGFANLNKSKKRKFGLMMEDYLTNRDELKQVFMLIDFRHKPSSDDIMMYNFLKHYKLPVTIIATKTDKIGITSQQKQRNIILEELDLVVGDEFVMFSNVTKVGKDEVYKKIGKEIIKQFDASIVDFYSEEDLKNGYIKIPNRKGKMEKYPLMTITVAMISNKIRKYNSVLELAEDGASVKKKAKTIQGSTFLENRRKNPAK